MLERITKNKPILYLLALIIILIILMITAITNRSDKTTPTQTIQSEAQKTVEITSLLDEQIYFPSVFQDSLYYLNSFGSEIVRYNQKTQEKAKIADLKLYYIEKVLFSPDYQKALILEKNSHNDRTYYIADFTDNSQKKLGKDIYDVSWSPDSQHIAYLYANGNKNFLSYSHYKENRWENLLEYNYSQAKIRWASKDSLILLPIASESWEGSELTKIDLKSRKATTIYSGRKVIDFELSLNGQIIAEDSKENIYLETNQELKQIISDQNINQLFLFENGFAFGQPVPNSFKWAFNTYDLSGKRIQSLEIEGDKEVIPGQSIIFTGHDSLFFETQLGYYKAGLVDKY